MSGLVVAMATFDGAAHLPAQLASLAAQEEPPAGLLVRDDGSRDGTLELLREHARTAPYPVEVLAGGERLGSTGSFAELLTVLAARSPVPALVALCDQDDVWRPDKTRVMREALAARPDALLAFSDAALVATDGTPLGGTAWGSRRLTPAVRRRLGAGEGLSALLERSYVVGMTAVLRGELLAHALPLPPDVLTGAVPFLRHDRWLSLVAAAHGPVVAVPEQLVDYRQHEGQQVGLSAEAATPTRRRLRAAVEVLRSGEESARVDGARRADLARREALDAHLRRGTVAPSVLRTLDEGLRCLRGRLALPTARRRRLLPVRRLARCGCYPLPAAAVVDVLRAPAGPRR